MSDVKNNVTDDWTSQRVTYIKMLKSPTEQQRLIVLLAEKKERTPSEERKLVVLVKAERAQQRAVEARARANAMLTAERKAAAKAERKARDHELYKVAGLLSLVGLVDKETGKPVVDTAALVGALAGLSELPRDNVKWAEWKKKGADILKDTSE